MLIVFLKLLTIISKSVRMCPKSVLCSNLDYRTVFIIKKIVQSSFRTDIENIFRTLGEESIWISKMK